MSETPADVIARGPTKLQCKDIPDLPVLKFLAKVSSGETFWYPEPSMQKAWGLKNAHTAGTWFWSDDFKPENSVIWAMPEGTPPRLALVKMRKLIKRGLVDGCACGCRGDFELTTSGRAMIAASQKP